MCSLQQRRVLTRGPGGLGQPRPAAGCLGCEHVCACAGELSEGGGSAGTDRLQQKACLERYRQASIKIMTLLRRLAPKARPAA